MMKFLLFLVVLITLKAEESSPCIQEGFLLKNDRVMVAENLFDIEICVEHMQDSSSLHLLDLVEISVLIKRNHEPYGEFNSYIFAGDIRIYAHNHQIVIESWGERGNKSVGIFWRLGEKNGILYLQGYSQILNGNKEYILLPFAGRKPDIPLQEVGLDLFKKWNQECMEKKLCLIQERRLQEKPSLVPLFRSNEEERELNLHFVEENSTIRGIEQRFNSTTKEGNL
ncbi:hypothetical protein CCZ01_08515 [Helicobacter monodelphidis]|uniref:hypothetical protein n=1 Tax=Helicobacter sp. 15-1451 TaxID=2004995 RepID=UPI000DCC1217|nr:hypothetical protein [Helicobacter sp. 15-1451]RAX56739.1 hypothetical protein CCZ01_08515 [Helicobacter sp. 15-1451]